MAKYLYGVIGGSAGLGRRYTAPMRTRWSWPIFLLLATAAGADPAAPPIGCSSALIIEESTGRVLYERAADVKRFPASTTKIMTAILMIEKLKTDDIITAPPDIKKVKPSSMHLMPGEKVPMLDLLYALMLRSANDAAVAAAVKISGSVPEFAKLMNERAKELGCTDTNFVTPNGLHDDMHYTTAKDLAKIAKHAMSLDLFREVVKTPKWTLTRSSNLEDLLVENKNRLLPLDPTVEGVKTGYTNPAGLCFVGCANRDGMRVFTVVLHSENWLTDTQALLKWGYKYYHRAEIVPTQKEFAIFPVKEGQKMEVKAVAGESVEAVALKTRDDLVYKSEPSGELKAPIKEGQRIGTLTIRDQKGSYVKQIPLVAAEDVPVQSKSPTIFAFIGGGGFLAMYAGLKRKRRRIDAVYN